MTERGMLLELAVETDDSQSEVRVIGEFDRLQVARFDRIAANAHAGVKRFVVDLAATTVIDSAALGSLVRLRHALDEVQCELVVIVALPFQETVMRIGGLFDYLGVVVRSAD